MNQLAIMVAVGLVLGVSGCTANEIRRDSNKSFTEVDQSAQDLLRNRTGRQPVAGPVVTDAPYVDVNPIPVARRDPLAFARIVNFSSASSDLSLHVFAQRVEAMTGVKVRYQEELNVTAPMPGISAVSPGPLTVSGVTLPGFDSSIALPTGAGQAGAPTFRINFNGTLRGLFEEVAEQTNSHWRWNSAGSIVEFYRYESESFRIAAVQGSGKTRFELGGSQNSSEGGAASLKLADTEASHETPESLWGDIDQTIQKLISPTGTFQVNQSAGLVMVRDRPDRMRMVRDYVKTLNDTLSRQVDIEITLYRVNINDRDFRGVSWEGLFQRLIDTSNYNIGWSNVRPDVVMERASSAVIRVPELDSNGIPNRYGGSQIFFDALSTIGRTSVQQSTWVMTTNNRAAPVKFVRRNSYLAETVPTYATGGGAAVNTGAGLTPGSVETGLNMYLLPHVQDDGKRMLMRVMVSLSTLDSIERETSGEMSIQLPQVSANEFANEAWLNSGETLVLTGFQQQDSQNTISSPFGRMWGLGGERTVAKGQQLLVIAITPVVSAARSRI